MINVFGDQGDFEVWSDTEVSFRDGRCLGVGKTINDALYAALRELESETAQLRRIIERQSP